MSLLQGLILAFASTIGAAIAREIPKVLPPADEFFAKVREQDREVAREFYKKHVDIDGLSVVSSAEVADEALLRTDEIVRRMLAGRPDILEAMVNSGMYLIIIGKDQVYTDMPEYRNHPNPAFQNERVRGTGGKPTSFGEENLLSLPLDRYDDESIAVHEFCHTIDGTLRRMDPEWTSRRNAAYRRAMDQGLWENTYAAGNPGEFWAEIAQSYFDCNRVNNWNHGPIGTREQLKAYDPESYELVRGIFNLRPEQDWRYSFARPLPNIEKPPAKFNIDPYYTKFTWAREFPVMGRGSRDEALLKANDTIRKMFAYRHDILKALIADGVKLVVLGREEKISDLPEVRKLENDSIDGLARFLDYNPRLKLLVVDEENLLLAEGNQIVRVFARALYEVAGRRPIDPNWEKRGREVQQYELRVRRLDVEFDRKVTNAFENAAKRTLWRGTPATIDPVTYWTEGVLAYFDATGQTPAPARSEHPIATREALRDYDSELHDLVKETMAYAGHVDWRYRN
jgi:hypothetical protein